MKRPKHGEVRERDGAGKQWDGKIVCVLHKIIREQGHEKEIGR
jgi:hypothetical protein